MTIYNQKRRRKNEEKSPNNTALTMKEVNTISFSKDTIESTFYKYVRPLPVVVSSETISS